MLIECTEILVSFSALLLVSLDYKMERLQLAPLTDNLYKSGGFLVNPATQFYAFRNIAFFKDYPYALPGFVSGAFCLSTAIVSAIYLQEVGSCIHLSLKSTHILYSHFRASSTLTDKRSKNLNCQHGNSSRHPESQ